MQLMAVVFPNWAAPPRPYYLRISLYLAVKVLKYGVGRKILKFGLI
jgi:hypothetical protein